MILSLMLTYKNLYDIYILFYELKLNTILTAAS